ncbi:MAG: hypothetical protein Kow0092_31150 [Deferrisomatales bacterium]
MGIFRILLYVILIWLLVKLVKSLKRRPPLERPRPGGRGSGGRLEGGELVQDPQCGVYIPKETAVRGPGGRLFCSPECRDAYRGKGG